MKIASNNLYNFTVTFFKEQIFFTFTSQQKMIAIASLAFCCLTAAYLLLYGRSHQKRKIFPLNPISQQIKPDQIEKQSPKVEKQSPKELQGEKSIHEPVENSLNKLEPKKTIVPQACRFPEINEKNVTDEAYQDGPYSPKRNSFHPIIDDSLSDEISESGQDNLLDKDRLKDSPSKELIEPDQDNLLDEERQLEIANHELDGHDIIILPNGNRLEGQFRNNQLHGQGKITFPDGTIWVGEFENGDLVQGKEIDPLGFISEGEFQNGYLVQGKMIQQNEDDDTQWEMEGEFQNGYLKKGKITWPWGDSHEGEFQKDALNGQGLIIKSDQTVLEGEFENDLLNGQGTIVHPNNTVEDGEFQNGMLIDGIIKKPDGTIFIGHFQNGQLNGKGKIIKPDGMIIKGRFQNGQLKSNGTIIYPKGKERRDFSQWKILNSL